MVSGVILMSRLGHPPQNRKTRKRQTPGGPPERLLLGAIKQVFTAVHACISTGGVAEEKLWQ
jgi:hypothetical protein